MLQLICIKNRMFLTFKHVSEMFASSHHKMFIISWYFPQDISCFVCLNVDLLADALKKAYRLQIPVDTAHKTLISSPK